MDRIGDAFAWPFRDPEWAGKIAVIGLIDLIPIIGGINGLGWMLATIDRLRAGDQRLPPGNFNYLERGIELFLVFLVYGIGLVIVGTVFFLPAVVLLSAQSADSGNAAVASLAVALMLIGLGAVIVCGLALTFATPALILATDRGGIGGGLDVPAVLRRARESGVNTLIAGLMLIAASFIGSLGSYACVVGLVFTVPYSQAMQAWIVRSYELGVTAPAGRQGGDG